MTLWQIMRRWRTVRKKLSEVVAINQRNLQWVYPYNARIDFPLADNKLLTKERMAVVKVPMPRTFHTYSAFYQLRNLERDLSLLHEFVIKPASGSAGSGILVIASRCGDEWRGVDGTTYALDDLARHITDIIFGIHSDELSDSAFIEERIHQHPVLHALCPFGLSDVRVILFKGIPVMAMLRLPTRQSHGKSNLHQGALGVGIDLKTGTATHASHFGEEITLHPDTRIELIGQPVPHWAEVIDLARRAASAVPLGYLGVDIAISREGPRLLEINVRPGLEIQNVNGKGLGPVLQDVLRQTAAGGGR